MARRTGMPDPSEALPGREQEIETAHAHFVFRTPLKGPFGEGMEMAMFGMGCFWGVERLFWQMPGVVSTAAGYAGGFTPNPTYEEVCTGLTGHNEVVRLVFDPRNISYDALLTAFFENHDPSQGMGQGNDIGTQYRSGIYCFSEGQLRRAGRKRDLYAQRLREAGHDRPITTEILPAPPFYFAEGYHQQYLAKNPHGYCSLGGLGIDCGK